MDFRDITNYHCVFLIFLGENKITAEEYRVVLESLKPVATVQGALV